MWMSQKPLTPYFYPRPLRGGRLIAVVVKYKAMKISIHALCEEGDLLLWFSWAMEPYFYPRPLRGGRRLTALLWSRCCCDFYPRPLRGGRPGCSAHGCPLASEFLSTPSARRATGTGESWFPFFVISIHALCEEGDSLMDTDALAQMDFYPRPLRGGRHAADGLLIRSGIFLSTPSARRATPPPRAGHRGQHISIHALCEEGDALPPSAVARWRYFYPRPLRGGRRSQVCRHSHCIKFLSTPSARRATRALHWPLLHRQISIHALCEEGDVRSDAVGAGYGNFYPRPLRGGRQQKQRQNLYFQTNYTTFCMNLEEP